MRRLALVLLLVLLPACAMAEPDVVRAVREWVWPPKVTSREPVPVPISRPKPDLRSSAPPAPAAAENSRPHSRDVKAKVAEPDSRQAPLPKPAQAKQKQQHKSKEVVRHFPEQPSGQHKTQPASADQERPARAITCADARKGVGMPCFLIRQNAWQYEQLSPAQKRQADACLTAQERAAIAACFR